MFYGNILFGNDVYVRIEGVKREDSCLYIVTYLWMLTECRKYFTRNAMDAMRCDGRGYKHTHIGIGERWGCLYQQWAYSSEENEALSKEREHVERTLQDK